MSWALLFSLQTQLWKQLGIFWKFPGEPQDQSHAMEELDQGKGLWSSVTAGTCVGGRKGQVRALPPPVYLPSPPTCSVREREQGRSHYKALLLNSHLLHRTFFVFPRAVLFPLNSGHKKALLPNKHLFGSFFLFSMWCVISQPCSKAVI